MKQETKYRFLHYDIFVLITVVLVVVVIHVIDGIRIYPESYYARKSYISNIVSKYKYKIELNNLTAYDSLVDYSLRYSDYIYDPDSVYTFCRLLGNSLKGMVGVAVVPSSNIYKTKDNFIPVYSRYISDETFNGAGYKNIDFIYNSYSWDKIRRHPDGTMDLLSDPFEVQIKGETFHVSLLSYPVLGRGDEVDATVVAAISLDDWSQYVKQLDVFDKGNIYIVSYSGKFFVHSDTSLIGEPSEAFLSEKYGRAAMELIDSAYIGYPKVYSHDEYDYMMFAVSSTSSLWTLFYSVDSGEVLSTIIDDIFFVSIVALIGVVIIILVCAYNIKWASDYKAEQSAIDRDLEIAANIQKRLLHKSSLSLPVIDIDVRHKPAKMVGGDLYYLHQYDSNLVFCVGDVSGKGIPAALLMSGVLTMLDLFVKQHKSPSEICSGLNTQLLEINKDFHFVTLFLAILDTHTGIMRYCNAGHDAPIYCGRFLKKSCNMPIGTDSSQQFVEDEMQLDDGSYLVLYTDGINEAQNSQNHFYGADRFLNSVTDSANSSAAIMNDRILSSLHGFVNGCEQSDDITLLTLIFSRK